MKCPESFAISNIRRNRIFQSFRRTVLSCFSTRIGAAVWIVAVTFASRVQRKAGRFRVFGLIALISSTVSE